MSLQVGSSDQDFQDEVPFQEALSRIWKVTLGGQGGKRNYWRRPSLYTAESCKSNQVMILAYPLGGWGLPCQAKAISMLKMSSTLWNL